MTKDMEAAREIADGMKAVFASESDRALLTDRIAAALAKVREECLHIIRTDREWHKARHAAARECGNDADAHTHMATIGTLASIEQAIRALAKEEQKP